MKTWFVVWASKESTTIVIGVYDNIDTATTEEARVKRASDLTGIDEVSI